MPFSVTGVYHGYKADLDPYMEIYLLIHQSLIHTAFLFRQNISMTFQTK